MKKCAGCGQTFDRASFYKRTSSSDGLSPYCHRCDLDKDLRKRYGIGVDEYDDMVGTQSGVCAICAQPCRTRARLSVDHCHETGRVRGLLCSRCNSFIGYADENEERLVAAAEYLERHRSCKPQTLP